MNRGQLSRREREARTKIIQEYHYDETEQRLMDRDVASHGWSYAKVYEDLGRGYDYAFATEIRMARAAAARAASRDGMSRRVPGRGPWWAY